MENKNEESNKKACHICHGMGALDNGHDTRDCPNPRCEHGFVKVEVK
jgi:hypothetical protein